MSETCLECDGLLVELREEKEQEQEPDGGVMDYTGPNFYWGFYGLWCPECKRMYERHHKSWLEVWKQKEE